MLMFLAKVRVNVKASEQVDFLMQYDKMTGYLKTHIAMLIISYNNVANVVIYASSCVTVWFDDLAMFAPGS